MPARSQETSARSDGVGIEGYAVFVAAIPREPCELTRGDRRAPGARAQLDEAERTSRQEYTVPGPQQTPTDFAGANDPERVRMLASPDVAITGRMLGSDLRKKAW